MKIAIRKATIKDLKFFHKLRNEVSTRKNSFKTKYIKISSHNEWYKKNLLNKNLIFLVGLVNKQKIGFIRFYKKKKITTISIAIAQKYRDRGYGSIFLKKSENFLKEKIKVIAIIKNGNKASIRFFEKNNYKILKRGKNHLKYYKKINFLTIQKRVLICVAHPDDETIGCGGAIAHHVKNKDKVYCIYMTDGVGARFSRIKNSLINERKKNSKLAAKILGFEWLSDYCGNFPDNGMDKVKLLEVVKKIEIVKQKIKPHIIYTHNPHDLNVDHRIVAAATLTAFRPQAKEVWNKILAFEIPSSTDFAYFKKNKVFQPNYFLDIRKFWAKKKKALQAYATEIKKFPNSRSLKGIEILSKFRGIQNGLEQAEAFQILKHIKK